MTRQFAEQVVAAFPVNADHSLELSRAYDPVAIPAFFLVNDEGAVRSPAGRMYSATLRAPTAHSGARCNSYARSGQTHSGGRRGRKVFRRHW